MTKVDVYKRILMDTVRREMEDEDILLHALVLHLYNIALPTDISLEDVDRSDNEERIVLAPLTRSHAAELLASLWRKKEERGKESFWHFRYNSFCGYEGLGDVPESLRARTIAARESIARHPLVHELILDVP